MREFTYTGFLEMMKKEQFDTATPVLVNDGSQKFVAMSQKQYNKLIHTLALQNSGE